MDLEEFRKQNPKFVQEAKKCDNEFDFTKLAEKYNIKFGTDSFKKAFDLFCNSNKNEKKDEKTISDDDLDKIAGGAGDAEINTAKIAGITLVNVATSEN